MVNIFFYNKQNKEDTWTCQSPCALSVRARNVEVRAYTSHSRFRKTVWNIFMHAIVRINLSSLLRAMKL